MTSPSALIWREASGRCTRGARAVGRGAAATKPTFRTTRLHSSGTSRRSAATLPGQACVVGAPAGNRVVDPYPARVVKVARHLFGNTGRRWLVAIVTWAWGGKFGRVGVYWTESLLADIFPCTPKCSANDPATAWEGPTWPGNAALGRPGPWVGSGCGDCFVMFLGDEESCKRSGARTTRQSCRAAEPDPRSAAWQGKPKMAFEIPTGLHGRSSAGSYSHKGDVSLGAARRFYAEIDTPQGGPETHAAWALTGHRV
jgi:hypothetical protein